MTRVLSIDAGRSTGLAVLDFLADEVALVELQQVIFPVKETVEYIESVDSEFTPDVIVAEQFDLRPGNEFVADLTTVEVNGALKYVYGPENIAWQTPGQAKGLVKDKALKNMGMWPTGKTVGQPDANDARDALRHGVYYGVTALKHRPTTLKGWPDAN